MVWRTVRAVCGVRRVRLVQGVRSTVWCAVYGGGCRWWVTRTEHGDGLGWYEDGTRVTVAHEDGLCCVHGGLVSPIAFPLFRCRLTSPLLRLPDDRRVPLFRLFRLLAGEHQSAPERLRIAQASPRTYRNRAYRLYRAVGQGIRVDLRGTQRIVFIG